MWQFPITFEHPSTLLVLVRLVISMHLPKLDYGRQNPKLNIEVQGALQHNETLRFETVLVMKRVQNKYLPTDLGDGEIILYACTNKPPTHRVEARGGLDEVLIELKCLLL